MSSIKELREKYRPDKIQYLLIAESPPICENDQVRFFYNPDQEKWDFMFKSIMDCVFPDFKASYKRGDKHHYLQRFKNKGFYMIDATDIPINNLTEKKRSELIESESESKIKEIEKIISKDTPILLIKKNIFLIFYRKLNDLGYNVVHDEFLPFPSSGHQSKFKDKFKRYLENVYNRNTSGNST
ncbi:MAG: hypothetical protein M1610_04405 [Nitrospirae bacterium]|nr:hypothetical protein [Nitrospirota bacterium]MCL5061937.1 hypothetical protein [Nitrospirota bacterium]